MEDEVSEKLTAVGQALHLPWTYTIRVVWRSPPNGKAPATGLAASAFALLALPWISPACDFRLYMSSARASVRDLSRAPAVAAGSHG